MTYYCIGSEFCIILLFILLTTGSFMKYNLKNDYKLNAK